MEKSSLELLVSRLAAIYINDNAGFASAVREQRGHIGIDDLRHLCDILKNGIPVHPNVDNSLLGLSGWISVCLDVVFELIYLLDEKALAVLESFAFGEYDWTQSRALIGLCHLYLAGKLHKDKIELIAVRLEEMRFETHLYFVEELLSRREQDARYDQFFHLFNKSDLFQEALTEIIPSPPLTRVELIVLGERIIAANESPEKLQKLMELFDSNVPYPQGSSLFYYPEDADGAGDYSQYNPPVEEVVDKCLAYKVRVI
ncbi:hypothetical protein HNQ91_001919 [Filimonas zeae]|uniref:Uncharacterized protein n=1 Tax=Filimonas zeae TaxID=1737353 RepID=A0A917MV86_9BACT|nr:hypothetical protein [Filimonas zeae]MDR6338868.1 hypothetical protein [Filimonas zeae]GGH66210.1 hypothetical protein GCM10011379_20150 [Filimonas zeae]